MRFQFIKNSEITSEHTHDIIALKSQHWNYPYDSQIKWLEDNLCENDIHLLMYRDEKLIGYLNIVEILINTENDNINAFGIGCVCIDKNELHKGYGTMLVNRASQYITQNNAISCLLCKKDLIKLYGKCCSYVVVSPENIFVAQKEFNDSLMFFNSDMYRKNNTITCSKTIRINRNF